MISVKTLSLNKSHFEELGIRASIYAQGKAQLNPSWGGRAESVTVLSNHGSEKFKNSQRTQPEQLPRGRSSTQDTTHLPSDQCRLFVPFHILKGT